MLARWWAFAVWAGVAGSALFWGLRLFVKAPAAPEQVSVAQAAPAAHGDLTRLLGVDPPPPPPPSAAAEPPPDSRFRLLGVVSPLGSGSEGVALIAVDGQQPKAYRIGAAVSGEVVLHSVSHRGAMLGPRGGPGSVTLELAPPPPPATGTLPSAAGAPGAAAPMGGAAGAFSAAVNPGIPPNAAPMAPVVTNAGTPITTPSGGPGVMRTGPSMPRGGKYPPIYAPDAKPQLAPPSPGDDNTR